MQDVAVWCIDKLGLPAGRMFAQQGHRARPVDVAGGEFAGADLLDKISGCHAREIREGGHDQNGLKSISRSAPMRVLLMRDSL